MSGRHGSYWSTHGTDRGRHDNRHWNGHAAYYDDQVDRGQRNSQRNYREETRDHRSNAERGRSSGGGHRKNYWNVHGTERARSDYRPRGDHHSYGRDVYVPQPINGAGNLAQGGQAGGTITNQHGNRYAIKGHHNRKETIPGAVYSYVRGDGSVAMRSSQAEAAARRARRAKKEKKKWNHVSRLEAELEEKEAQLREKEKNIDDLERIQIVVEFDSKETKEENAQLLQENKEIKEYLREQVPMRISSSSAASTNNGRKSKTPCRVAKRRNGAHGRDVDRRPVQRKTGGGAAKVIPKRRQRSPSDSSSSEDSSSSSSSEEESSREKGNRGTSQGQQQRGRSSKKPVSVVRRILDKDANQTGANGKNAAPAGSRNNELLQASEGRREKGIMEVHGSASSASSKGNNVEPRVVLKAKSVLAGEAGGQDGAEAEVQMTASSQREAHDGEGEPETIRRRIVIDQIAKGDTIVTRDQRMEITTGARTTIMRSRQDFGICRVNQQGRQQEIGSR